MAVGEAMACQPTVLVDVLDDDEAWALFRMKAELDERVSREILEEAKKVAEECQDLPVAIVTVASALKGTQTREGWELARTKLESIRLPEIGGNIEEEKERNAYRCIKMSYEYLKKETTKRCFLLCALYPQDHSIGVEDLVRHAWGLKLYGKTKSVEEVRTKVLEAIDCLKDSCLLLEDEDKNEDEDDDKDEDDDDDDDEEEDDQGEDKDDDNENDEDKDEDEDEHEAKAEAVYKDIGRHVKLHVIVRDVALWIAFKEESGFTIKSRFELLNDSIETCKAISLLDSERKKFPDKLVCPELEVLLLKNCTVQGLCFQGMQELKVLSLTMEKSGRNISLYPLQFLEKLSSLRLENFEDFSFLGNLKTLEIFCLRGSRSEGLADELRELENLKILDLSDSKFSNGIPGDVIIRLSKLEELYLRSMEGESTAILQEINFLNLLTTLSLAASSSHFPEDFQFPKLERFDICINSSRSDVTNGRERRLRVDRSLIVKMSNLNLVSELLENVESLRVLELEDECLIDRRQKMLVPKMLQTLKEVSIENCENLKVVFQNVQENVGPLLSNLKLLCLRSLPKLSHIWELPIQHVRLEALVKLNIWSCQSLKSIFSISLAQSLVLLEHLEISLCDELKQIVTEPAGDDEEIPMSINSPNSLCFPKLKDVDIDGCDGLEYIFPSLMAPQGLPKLESVSVHDCCQLKQLVRSIEGRTENDVMFKQLQFSKPLKLFSVSDCPLSSNSFVHLEVEEAYLEKVQLSAFKGSFSCRKHLELSGTTENYNLVPEANEDGLNGLTSLIVDSCHDLECLVDTTVGNGPTSAFTHLEKLNISYCQSMKTLCKGQPPHGFLKNLKDLSMEGCNELQPLLNLPSFSLQSLKVVNIEKCCNLESLFSASLIQSLVMLEELWVSYCFKLKTLITELENNDGETDSNSSPLTLFLPKLKTLDIRGCPKLKYVLPITLAKGLSALATISVFECDELKQVFGMEKEQNGVEQDDNVCLSNLRDLRLCYLRNLSCFSPESYIFKTPVLTNLKVDGCPQLTKFAISQVDKKLH
ncbi:hypothetical protein V6N13_049933 [Hibiscus sabdariffa]|uniref:Disease resistance protein At4g27190-like leucine-rich repeats domain-containing protein n=1 Tax=Hibiscus sabdariffa TaxID=183260 RepID=A0ABR2QW65_9ROSI